jgi:hypothetical protein
MNRYEIPKRFIDQFNNIPPHQNPNNLSTHIETHYKDMLPNRNYNNDTDEGYDLLRAIGRHNRGISFNPYLTTERTARLWFNEQQKKNKLIGYGIRVEDLDNDPKTPDDVIIIDRNGTPKYVSGYHFNTGLNRRKAAVLHHNFPIKKEVKELLKQLQKDPKLKKSFYRYLSDQNKKCKLYIIFLRMESSSYTCITSSLSKIS